MRIAATVLQIRCDYCQEVWGQFIGTNLHDCEVQARTQGWQLNQSTSCKGCHEDSKKPQPMFHPAHPLMKSLEHRDFKAQFKT